MDCFASLAMTASTHAITLARITLARGWRPRRRRDFRPERDYDQCTSPATKACFGHYRLAKPHSREKTGLRLTAAAVTTPHAFTHRNFGPHRRTAFDRSWLGADRAGRPRRLRRPQRGRQIDAVCRDPRRTAARRRFHRDPAALAGRQPGPGGPERAGKPDRNRAQGGPRARRAAAGSRHRPRSAPDRRHPDPAGRHRRPFGARPGRGDPQRPRIFDRGPGAALPGIFRRLADAGRARRDAVRRARSPAAGRADQLSRSRGHAVARRPSGELSAHRDRHQP